LIFRKAVTLFTSSRIVTMATHTIPSEGGALDVKVGDRVTFSEKATPSTGFDWMFHGVPSNFEEVENATTGAAAAAGGPPVMGAPKVHTVTWVVKARDAEAANHEILFGYVKKWEVKDPAADLKQKVVITVADGDAAAAAAAPAGAEGTAAAEPTGATHNVGTEGGTFDVKVGDRVVFEAEAKPSTGFAWHFDGLPESFAEIENATTKGAGIGAAGTQRMVWHVKAAGAHTVHFGYAQKWEIKDPAADLKQVAVFNVAA
jgi:predicted secreted protein